MRLADAAWHEVDTTTIRNCWRKAGILPEISSPMASSFPSVLISSLVNDQDAVVEAESQLEKALDTLQATGALQSLNQMAIDVLLNPLDESTMMDESTDEEIYEAMMDARKEDEAGDNDNEDSNPADIWPTQKEALSAALTIQKYIQDIDDPFACQLEGIFGLFGHQTHLLEAQSMVPTLLTDFFGCK